MPISNKIVLAVFITLIGIICLITPNKTLSYFALVVANQEQTGESQMPVTDYFAPESKDLAERAKRKEKGQRHRYTAKRIKEEPQISEVSDSSSLVERLVPLPIADSDVVVIGEVRNAEAYLSDDKTAIYSEFSIRLEQILKSNVETSLIPGSMIVAERKGGGVRFPSGHVQRYGVDGERMPKVWSRYVFFLKGNDPGQGFRLLKGYELRAGRVFPMDYFSRDAVYERVDQDIFIDAVRDALTHKSV